MTNLSTHLGVTGPGGEQARQEVAVDVMRVRPPQLTTGGINPASNPLAPILNARSQVLDGGLPQRLWWWLWWGGRVEVASRFCGRSCVLLGVVGSEEANCVFVGALYRFRSLAAVIGSSEPLA